MNNANSSFWKNIATLGQNILAHVNITYDGSKGSLHIDIVPMDDQYVVHDPHKVVEDSRDPKLLANKRIADGEVADKQVRERSSADESGALTIPEVSI